MTPATVADAVAFRRIASGRRWRPLALGILWGIAVSAMQVAPLPVYGDANAKFWALVAWIVPGWSVVGIGIALVAEFADAAAGRPASAVAWLAGCALTFSAVWSWLYSLDAVSRHDSAMAALFPNGVDPVAAFAYQSWTVLFYGGLYFAAWRLHRRGELTRALLNRADVARARAETLVGEAQLATLQGYVDPDMLLRVMSEVERRYAHADASAVELLDLLVAFLRLAMPAVRSGRSTLADEVAIVRACVAIQREIDGSGTCCAIIGESPRDLPFPPLLLLPLLEACRSASSSPSSIAVQVGTQAGAVTICFVGAPMPRSDWIPADLHYRIRVALSTLYGGAWSLAANATDSATDAALLLTVMPARIDPAPGPDVCMRSTPRKELIHGDE